MNIDGPVGKAMLKRLVGDESRFASEPQFHLSRCEDNSAWLITQEAKAINPTLVNGNPVSGNGVKLLTGSEITIGTDKVRLRVRIEL